jgi:hypothetical protein
MADNIFPDLSNERFDVKYHQLRVLGSDIRRSLGGGRYSTGTGADPVQPPEDSGGGGGGGDSGSSSSGGPDECRRWINLGRDPSDGVSYVDCEGNPVLGVSIDPYEAFCAFEVTNFGVCGALVVVGPCVECAPCCAPVINSVSVN